MLCVLLVLLLARMSLASRETADVSKESADIAIGEWMAGVDRLLLQQDERLRKLEAENRHLRAENQQLQTNDSEMKDELFRLKEKLLSFQASTDSASSENQQAAQIREVVGRADDTSPLEPVVTQLAQRLTDVSAEIQANTARIQTLQNAKLQQDAAIQQAGSSSYVRWGKSTCPSSTSLVYSGVVGGSYFNHPGAAANVLCLTLSPVLSDHTIPGEHSELYGAEYETWDAHYQKDVVCAVCRSQRPTTIMVPGTNVCMPGWTVEYSGFLMANYVAYLAGTDYICVDSAMENRVGGDENSDGLLLHYTKAVCGSLPCSPYVSGKAVTCVVCSQ